MSVARSLPELELDAWEPTRDTLHLWLQIVGKLKLQAAPPRNHWWHAALYVDVRGLTTRRLHRDGTTFQVDFDLVDHDLVLRTHRGEEERLPLRDGLSVADFDAAFHAMLAGVGVDAELVEHPFATPVSQIPFGEDRTHASYDAAAAHAFWRALDWIDEVLEEFAGRSTAKTSPVNLFWHSFDLAVTRFSGRRAPDAPDADPVTREAYSHELISFGFWPGDKDQRFPAFYSYTAPEPGGLRDQPLRPDGAAWRELPNGSIALLPYEEVRGAGDPRATLLAFLQSGYDAGARTAGWDRDLERAG